MYKKNGTENKSWWRSFRKLPCRTKFDIYSFIELEIAYNCVQIYYILMFRLPPFYRQSCTQVGRIFRREETFSPKVRCNKRSKLSPFVHLSKHSFLYFSRLHSLFSRSFIQKSPPCIHIKTHTFLWSMNIPFWTRAYRVSCELIKFIQFVLL